MLWCAFPFHPSTFLPLRTVRFAAADDTVSARGPNVRFVIGDDQARGTQTRGLGDFVEPRSIRLMTALAD